MLGLQTWADLRRRQKASGHPKESTATSPGLCHRAQLGPALHAAFRTAGKAQRKNEQHVKDGPTI